MIKYLLILLLAIFIYYFCFAKNSESFTASEMKTQKRKTDRLERKTARLERKTDRLERKTERVERTPKAKLEPRENSVSVDGRKSRVVRKKRKRSNKKRKADKARNM
jgi:hypothetical protein